jgi:hypothetical protein
MIVRFSIDSANFGESGHSGEYTYRVSHEGELLFSDEGLSSIEACIVAAAEGLGREAVGAEIAYRGIISGTYPLATLALASSQLAEHAQNTTSAMEEVLP